MQPILSFCIPTRNRPEQLAQVLIRLAPQLVPGVEVVVLDDSTNDLSEIVVKKHLPSARYIKGEKIGLDLATMYLLEHVAGKWMWYFSDDDELRPGAISHILETLKRYPEIDFMWVNFFYDNGRKIAVNREEGFFRDRDDVFETLGTNISLMSTLILKREAGLPYLALGRKHSIGFAFAIHIPIFGALTGKGKFYLMKPFVSNYPTSVAEIKKIVEKQGENNGFDIYGVNFHDTINLFKDGFSRRAIRSIQAANFAALWRGILVGWVGGWDTPKGKRWRMFKMYWSYPEFWIAMPIMLAPLWINRGLYRFYKLFFNERRWRWGRKEQAITPTS